MVTIENLTVNRAKLIKGHRLVNAKFPPIHLFDDVASPAEFDALHQIQALTNPRLQQLTGKLSLIDQRKIPYGIKGCSYAVAPFVHLNPLGSRFSNGSFGMLYIADNINTALKEVSYHQTKYWQNVVELKYERFMFRGLSCTFNEKNILSALKIPKTESIYDKDHYQDSQALGSLIKNSNHHGIRYYSVRQNKAICWALNTPEQVKSIVQTSHFQMIWKDKITNIEKLQVKRDSF